MYYQPEHEPNVLIVGEPFNNNVLTLNLPSDRINNRPGERRNKRVGNFVRPLYSGINIPMNVPVDYRYLEPVPGDAKVDSMFEDTPGMLPRQVFIIGETSSRYKLHGTNPGNNLFMILIDVEVEDELLGTRTDYVLGFRQGNEIYAFHAPAQDFNIAEPYSTRKPDYYIKPYRGHKAFYLRHLNSQARYGLFFIGKDRFIIGSYSRYFNTFHACTLN